MKRREDLNQIKEMWEKINNSPYLWLKKFVKIIDNENNMVPFNLNSEQQDFLKNAGRYNIICKARQLGFSTLALGIMLYEVHQRDNITCLLIADKSDSVANLFERLKIMYQSIPDGIRQPAIKDNRNELILDNGSRIYVMTAGTKELGRSYTAHIIHLSEFAFWGETTQERALLSLEQALAKNDSAKLIIESTANGLSNKYYDVFRSAIKGHSKYKAFFYGWANGQAHKKQFKHEIHEGVEWYRSINNGQRLSNKPFELDAYELKLMEETDVNLNQLMWRRYKLLDMTQNEFQQEFPAFWNEAFISSGYSVFDSQVLAERMAFTPKPLTISEVGNLGALNKYVGKELKIYKLPQTNEKYYGGIDTSAGLRQDNSTITILDSNGEQVVQFASNELAPYKFVDVVEQLGYLYNYCMYVPERNTYGLDVITRLVKEKQYIQVLRMKRFDKITGRSKWDYGYFSNSVSKARLINDLREAFDLGLIVVNDMDTLEEMRVYIREEGGSYRNKQGKFKDDRVDSLALAVQSLKSGKSYI